MKEKMLVAKRIWVLMLVVALAIQVVPEKIARADDYNGGWARANVFQTVYTATDGATSVGVVYKNEAFTVLWASGNIAYIDFSSPSATNGTKRGYLINPNYTFWQSSTSVAQAYSYTNVYYGENTSTYKKVGSISSGEFVTVFGTSNGWAYIEYNTTSGRKRGYVPESNLNIFYWGRLGGFDNKTGMQWNPWISGTRTVYAGPSTEYATVGSVSNEYVISYGYGVMDADGVHYEYIEYYVNGTSQMKSGFIIN